MKRQQNFAGFLPNVIGSHTNLFYNMTGGFFISSLWCTMNPSDGGILSENQVVAHEMVTSACA
jgi:hypothetical protein